MRTELADYTHSHAQLLGRVWFKAAQEYHANDKCCETLTLSLHACFEFEAYDQWHCRGIFAQPLDLLPS